MKRFVILMCMCLVFLSGCSVVGAPEATTEDKYSAEEHIATQAFQYTDLSFETDRTVIGLVDYKLVYYVVELPVDEFGHAAGGGVNNKIIFYCLNTKSAEERRLGEFDYGNYSSTASSAVVGDKVYFWKCDVYAEGTRNRLFELDLKEYTASVFSEYDCGFTVSTPFALVNGEMLAVKKYRDRENKTTDYSLVKVKDNGKLKEIKLGKNEIINIADNANKNSGLAAIEKAGTGEDTRYYLTQYSPDLELIESADVTAIFKQYNYSEDFVFSMFGNCFMFKEPGEGNVLCRLDSGVPEVIHKDDWVYKHIENLGPPDEKYEYFFTDGTNEIYCLNIETGEVSPKSHNNENETHYLIGACRWGDDFLLEKLHKDFGNLPREEQLKRLFITRLG